MSSFSVATSTDTKQQIIASLFSKRSAEGPLEETYISHLKIWEDVPEGQHVANGNVAGDDGRKARYLMLAVTRFGKVLLHKAKRNTNMSFSKGKTWNLEDLRQVEVIEPQAYALTMTSRTYIWQTEKPRDQAAFLITLLKVYRKYTQGKLPTMINISLDEPGYDGGATSPPIMSTSPPIVQPPQMRDRQGSTASFNSSGPGNFHPPIPRNGHSPAPPPLPIGINNGHSNGNGSGDYGRSPLSRSYMDSAGPAPTSAMSSAYSPFPPQQSNAAYSSSAGSYQQQQVPPPPPAPAPRRPSDEQYAQPMQHTNSSNGAGLASSVGSSSNGVPKSSSERSLGSDVGGLRDPWASQGTNGNQQAVVKKTSKNQLREVQPDRPARNRRPSDSQSRSTTPVPPPAQAAALASSPPRARTPTQTERRPNLSASRSREKIRSQYQPSDVPPAVPTAPPQFNVTQPSPKSSPNLPSGGLDLPSGQRAIARRASFHPPQQSIPYSRDILLRGASFSQGEALVDRNEDGLALEDETMANVEEMLDGFDWSLEGGGQQQQSTTEAVEARLMDELNALDAANIHAFLEQDDRIGSVLKGIDEAVGELNEMDSHLASYKMQLNGVTEDIAYIESLNRGLQVQTSNQKALLSELEVLLTNMQVDNDALKSLTQGSLETDKGIEILEIALAALYRALLSSRDADHGDMAATMQHVREYETHNRQFCTRLIDYLLIMFRFQADIATQNAAKQVVSGVIPPHAQLEDKLGKYCGLILYMKEMDEERYQKLCGNYFSSASELHGKEMKDCFMSLINKVKRPADDDKFDGTFAGAAVSGPSKLGAMSRSKAMMGNLRGAEKKDKRLDGEMTACEAFERGLQQVSAQITREEAFIADFLQISDAVITYADYMDLDVYFRRQASRVLAKGMSPATLKLRRSALDLIFGFLAGEIKDWVDGALQREPLQVFGISAACDRFCADAEARNSLFFLNLVQKQQGRMAMLANQFVSEQVRVIEAQKTNLKRRKGVCFFVRYLPSFAAQIEQQLVDCDELPVRQLANEAIARTTAAMFDTVQHIAKTDRSDAGEEKGQLNFHIIIIENMHYLVQDAAKYDLAVLDDCAHRAKEMYDEQMVLYIKALLRKSFSKPMDFFGAVQRQMETSAPQEISSASGFNKSALKRATKDVSTQKDLRKAVEALAKRVEKHFSEDALGETGHSTMVSAFGGDAASVDSKDLNAGLVSAVWSACQRYMTDEVGRWQVVMGRVYEAEANAGVGLEWGVDALQSIMQKAKP